MSTLSVRPADSLHKQIRRLAKQEGMSINQFMSTAAAEKMAALMTLDYLEERAKRGHATAGAEDHHELLLKVVKVSEPR